MTENTSSEPCEPLPLEIYQSECMFNLWLQLWELAKGKQYVWSDRNEWANF